MVDYSGVGFFALFYKGDAMSGLLHFGEVLAVKFGQSASRQVVVSSAAC